jgi:hypothetical protein
MLINSTIQKADLSDVAVSIEISSQYKVLHIQLNINIMNVNYTTWIPEIL